MNARTRTNAITIPLSLVRAVVMIVITLSTTYIGSYSPSAGHSQQYWLDEIHLGELRIESGGPNNLVACKGTSHTLPSIPSLINCPLNTQIETPVGQLNIMTSYFRRSIPNWEPIIRPLYLLRHSPVSPTLVID